MSKKKEMTNEEMREYLSSMIEEYTALIKEVKEIKKQVSKTLEDARLLLRNIIEENLED